MRHLAELEHHECIGGRRHRSDDRLDLRYGNTELGAYPGGKAGEIRPCLDVQVAEEAVEPPSGNCRAAEENECRYRENKLFHALPP
jgi:hypothetical protein